MFKPLPHKNNGFTLIELSITLVIIGFIVGGVLTGQEMIKASTIRSTIKQYQEFQIATNIFRNKYDGLPGDLLTTKAAAFSLCPDAGCLSGGSGSGDGNGTLSYYRESFAFWNQLYWAELINGDFESANITNAANFCFPTTQGTDGNLRRYLAPSKLKSTIYFQVMDGGSATNYYALSGLVEVRNIAGSVQLPVLSNARSLTPTEAFQLDSKLDDEKPLTGKVLAWNQRALGSNPLMDSTKPTWSTATPANAVAGNCITGGSSDSDTANIYATAASASANTPACPLRLDF